jgi:tetratricopeptide (TPR) repeat protein
MFGGTVGGLHSDIINASPDSKESAARLIAEIKDRAKSSIKFKDYPSAVRLYDKAIEVSSVAELTANENAILHANKSMVFLSMNKGVDALTAANQAISADITYVKAYYRKAMASIQLANYAEAAAALESGLVLAPDDKELLTQRAKIVEILKSGPPSKPAANTAKASSPSPPSSLSSSSIVPPKTSTMSAADDDGDSEKIRGYRIKEDGTKTTFFNRDLDETAKSLIGDIRPKKIEEAAAPSVVAPAVAGASAWNSAGTHESYDKSPATSRAITSNLQNKLTYTSGEYSFEFCKIDSIEGDSQLMMARGKKKLVYDYTVNVSVTVKSSTSGSSSYCNLVISDVTSDLSSEIEVQIKAATGLNINAITNTLIARVKEALKAANDELFAAFISV